MKSIRTVSRQEWLHISSDPKSLLLELESESIYIVKNYLTSQMCDLIRSECKYFADQTGATWYPLLKSCPDYYRIHNRYQNAHVQTVQNGWYFHTWNDRFAWYLAIPGVSELFQLKQKIGELADSSFLSNEADSGPVARIVIHRYPRGGGGQDEHRDPVSNFARCQTVIQLSAPGVDYESGGFFVRDSSGTVSNLDKLTGKGDLLVISPGLSHGVESIDPDENLDWNSSDGRWIMLPVILLSDHFSDTAERPRKAIS